MIHTSLCVEPREGHLYVFMPPLGQLEHYLDLLACVEQTAADLAMPVLVEGLRATVRLAAAQIAVTPDPGVIEVNIHPASDWDELKRNIEGLYEDARQSRLGTEIHAGWAAHRYRWWQPRHPGWCHAERQPIPAPARSAAQFAHLLAASSQSVHLFSGLFIGPTSQAPRVDEARNDSLYELEIAFQQMPAGEVPQPWLVDRLLRNLLVDLSGTPTAPNFASTSCTRRIPPPGGWAWWKCARFRDAAACPHEPDADAAVARFGGAVLGAAHAGRELVRWGTRIHDQFMLPHYVWADFQDVIGELNDAGYPFRATGFCRSSSSVFRTMATSSIAMSIWNCARPGAMACAGRRAGTGWHRPLCRFLGGANAGQGARHDRRAACGGLQRSAGTVAPDRGSGRIRGRRSLPAWQPPSALHPTIPVHAPLVFDLVDTWNQRSIGGCTYHVQHPGGRNPDTFPSTPTKRKRGVSPDFWPYGHTLGR